MEPPAAEIDEEAVDAIARLCHVLGMSLVDFVKEPAARAVHDRHATVRSMRLPRHEALVACPDTRLAGAIGTAFDYMVRLRLHALCRERGTTCLEGDWIAEAALAAMREQAWLLPWVPRWTRLLEAARSLQEAMASGWDVEPERIARCAQYLGAADLLVRVGSFRPDFRHSDSVTRELVGLDACFDYPALMPAGDGVLCLNPVLPAGSHVGGADPDVISGSAIIDIKTTIRPSADSARLRQVCAYAVLCDAGGIRVGGGRLMALPPVTHVGFSFSRQNLHVLYSLDELFDGRYAQYSHELMELASRPKPS